MNGRLIASPLVVLRWLCVITATSLFGLAWIWALRGGLDAMTAGNTTTLIFVLSTVTVAGWLSFVALLFKNA